MRGCYSTYLHLFTASWRRKGVIRDDGLGPWPLFLLRVNLPAFGQIPLLAPHLLKTRCLPRPSFPLPLGDFVYNRQYSAQFSAYLHSSHLSWEDKTTVSVIISFLRWPPEGATSARFPQDWPCRSRSTFASAFYAVFQKMTESYYWKAWKHLHRKGAKTNGK